MMNKYILKNGKKLHYGFTTGSCAAAASKAACMMLFEKKRIKKVFIDTPKGWELELVINDIEIKDNYVKCSVMKDAGDDPDVTDKIKVFAKAKIIKGENIEITAGKGIGIVTKRGLSVEAGKPAINPVPMNMIINEINKIKPKGKGVKIELSVPDGEKIAEKTFNSKLGISGGISIIGTTGIVEPISDNAIIETISLHLSVLKNEGINRVVFVPGNYGEKFIIENYNIDKKYIIKIGNFIKESFEKANFHGIKNILLAGHISKLIKIAGGIYNTHSRIADARLEILSSNYSYFTDDIAVIKKIMKSNTVEEALDLIKNNEFYKFISEKIKKKCRELLKNNINIEVAVFSLNNGFLACSEGVKKLLKKYV